jgi:hypothetical protein
MNMNALVLCNSASPAYSEYRQQVLPYLEHFGVPLACCDLARKPLPADLDDYPLIVIAHRQLDPTGTRLAPGGRQRLLQAAVQGCGLVSFDNNLPILNEMGMISSAQTGAESTKACEITFQLSHAITAGHEPGELLILAGELDVPMLPADEESVLVTAGGKPLLAVNSLGQGRVARWATSGWIYSGILGPLAGLDDVFWRTLVWAARKPFALRGLPPLAAMRVDDVAGTGSRWEQSPLYWLETANRFGFKPWLGLFIFNLEEAAIQQLRPHLMEGSATAFPHAFGRPPRGSSEALPYFDQGLPLSASSYDEFIYFDHQNGCPLTDAQAQKNLAAVDGWYATHTPLPISPYAIAHWGEMSSKVMAHIHDHWGCDLVATYNDCDVPLADSTPWLVAGPFRKYEKPGTAFFDPAQRGQRPVYYADFINFGQRPFFLCFTEIRNVAGYEWAPDNNVVATVRRGITQMRRAFESMALPVLFTHETDYIYKISPDTWAEEFKQISAGIRGNNPIYVTLDEGIQYVRATKTSKFETCYWDADSHQVSATFSGYTDCTTHFYLFGEEDGQLTSRLIEIPPFKGQVTVDVLF